MIPTDVTTIGAPIMAPGIWNRRIAKHPRSINNKEDPSSLDTTHTNENPKKPKRPRLIEWNTDNDHYVLSSCSAGLEASFLSFRDETSRDSHASEESSCNHNSAVVPERMAASPDTLSTGATSTACASETATHEPNNNEDHDHDEDDDDGTVVASNTSTMTDLEDWVEGLTFGKSSWSLLDLKAARRRHPGHCPDNEDHDNDDSKLESSNDSHNNNKRANAAFIRAKQREARRCMLQHHPLHPPSEISTIQENP
eukprot:scaffold25994_cov40-Attheya_sp.AAC.2